jgi:hypothetical protein
VGHGSLVKDIPDATAPEREPLSFLAAHYRNLRIARNDKRVAKKGSMGGTQFFVILIVAVMAVALIPDPADEILAQISTDEAHDHSS